MCLADGGNWIVDFLFSRPFILCPTTFKPLTETCVQSHSVSRKRLIFSAVSWANELLDEVSR